MNTKTDPKLKELSKDELIEKVIAAREIWQLQQKKIHTLEKDLKVRLDRINELDDMLVEISAHHGHIYSHAEHTYRMLEPYIKKKE